MELCSWTPGTFPVCGDSGTQAPPSACAVFRQSPETSVSSCWKEKQTVDKAYSSSTQILLRAASYTDILDLRGAVIIITGSPAHPSKNRTLWKGVQTHEAASYFCHRLPPGHQVSVWPPSERRQPKVPPDAASRTKSRHSGSCVPLAQRPLNSKANCLPTSPATNLM